LQINTLLQLVIYLNAQKSISRSKVSIEYRKLNADTNAESQDI